MIKFIDNFLKTKTVDYKELNNFIIEYCRLNEVAEPTSLQLKGIVQLIQQGMFDLNYAIRQYCRLKEYNIIDIFSKNNVLIISLIINGNEKVNNNSFERI